MSRAKVLTIFGLFIAVSASSAEAGWHEFWSRFHLDFHRNNCWPEPFTTVDRKSVNAPFGQMIANGWKRQNTLSSHYFNPETNQLTDGGRRKVHWIVTKAPEEHRTVFVADAYARGASEIRLASVRQEVESHADGSGAMPSVVRTPHEPRGWSAGYIDAVQRKEKATIPNPRLPAFQEAGAGSGG